MKKVIHKQYCSKITKKFAKLHKTCNTVALASFKRALSPLKFKGKKVLDMGCGTGHDLLELQKKGAKIYGIDSSKNMICHAMQENPDGNFCIACFEKIPYKNGSFDVVVSKYALQTSKHLTIALKEAHRVLKPGGMFICLAVHPIRQFMEKNKRKKNYFKREIVASNIFKGTITVYEPSHTIEEYLNADFLEHFEIMSFEEKFEPTSAEMVEGAKYPAFFCMTAKKKHIKPR